MARKIIVTLIRYDLRIHDHAAFHAAHQPNNSDVTHLLPLYVFDERHVELGGLPGYVREGPEARTRLCGFWRSGVFRTRFLAEGVYDLKARLRTKGSDLLVRFGKTEDVALNIVNALRANGDVVAGVYMQKEHTSEELIVDRRLEKMLKKVGVPLTTFDTKALINPLDLPFPVHRTPDVFTPFRKQVESNGPVGRSPFVMPATFKPFPNPGPNFKPPPTSSYGSVFDKTGLDALLPHLLAPLREEPGSGKYVDQPRSPDSAVPFKGGETAALERLHQYFHVGNPPPVATYKQTRNGLLGHEYSTKFSVFLSLGMLSPRLIMQSLDEHEAKFGETDNTYWVRFELLWRDYFVFIGQKFGDNMFKIGGIEKVLLPREAHIKMAPGWWKPWDPKRGKDQVINKWLEGRTGVPFIDANMIELRETGFMGNRGRQNVASFLTKDLKYDWRIGAEFFESLLIDHDPTSNWGNWCSTAGVGTDSRDARQFNPIKQAHDYDPQGAFIKVWLPQLAQIPVNKIQTPWLLSSVERDQLLPHGAGEEVYPSRPVVEQSNWKSHYARGSQNGANKFGGNPKERVKERGLGPKNNRPVVEGQGGHQAGGEGGSNGGRGGNRGSNSRGRGGHAQ